MLLQSSATIHIVVRYTKQGNYAYCYPHFSRLKSATLCVQFQPIFSASLHY